MVRACTVYVNVALSSAVATVRLRLDAQRPTPHGALVRVGRLAVTDEPEPPQDACGGVLRGQRVCGDHAHAERPGALDPRTRSDGYAASCRLLLGELRERPVAAQLHVPQHTKGGAPLPILLTRGEVNRLWVCAPDVTVTPAAVDRGVQLAMPTRRSAFPCLQVKARPRTRTQ